MIEFSLIWLIAWLLVIATLQFIYKGKSWFVRYLFMVGLPITIVSLGIAAIIVYYSFRRHDSAVLHNFYHANVLFILKGWDYTHVSNGQKEG